MVFQLREGEMGEDGGRKRKLTLKCFLSFLFIKKKDKKTLLILYFII